jgi:predicted O-methyltransferase YrrM
MSLRSRFDWYALAFGRRLARLGSRTLLEIDYSPSSLDAPRYGHGRPVHPRLNKLIGEHEGRYRSHLETLIAFRDDLVRIPAEVTAPGEPHWVQTWLLGLDVISLYGFVRTSRPRRYLEIGSGVSTTWVRRAIRDGGLDTEITSVDPKPRKDIDALCDRVLRQPLEAVELGLFEELEDGDVLFMDGSHRAFMNSDVTTFFLDVLPALRPGVLVSIHDILLPEDYPADWALRYYSEQYLLATQLLGGGQGVRIELPCNYVAKSSGLLDVLAPVWNVVDQRVVRRGYCFWFTKV